jgi:ATP-binding cassette subfamily F protein 3
MLLSANISEKSFGNKILYKDLSFDIQKAEKIGLIGRNGTGKSTLLGILTGDDKDFEGEVISKGGAIIVSSRQEHHGHEAKTVLEYIQGDLPEYAELTHIIDTYPDTMGNNQKLIQEFSSALERFGELNYYQIEDELNQALAIYQIDSSYLHKKIGSLSGGQKRMIELIKVQRSRGHLALIDEPTNHMDYVAKQVFIKWMNSTAEAVLVVTHDRDVLSNVDRILEIRDGRCFGFKGNYTAYLKTNTNQVTSSVNEYDLSQRRINNLRQDIIRFRRLKEKSRTPGTIKRFKSQEQKAETELQKLLSKDKPSFWIDQDSAEGMSDKLASAYDKYKATNIKISTKESSSTGDSRLLLKVSHLSLGYNNTPLFNDMNFTLREGERVRLHGRNGVGKSTLVKALISNTSGNEASPTVISGQISVETGIMIGLYEQEIDPDYLDSTLNQAIESILRRKDLPIDPQHIKKLLGDYLFNPITDGDLPVSRLSGGQKARLQLIAMLAGNPQILILDEPTNHLDLPSIEELEKTLVNYHGAILYISHDSLFADKLGGQIIKITSED